MIADGAIVDADINASAAIGLIKLATGTLPSGVQVASANVSMEPSLMQILMQLQLLH